jgi:hypothetical protein
LTVLPDLDVFIEDNTMMMHCPLLLASWPMGAMQWH